MMQVLITGGAGFLGQAIIARYLKDGHVKVDGQARPFSQIVCLDQSAGVITDARVHNVVADLDQVAQYVTAQTGLVIHLAAVVSGTAEANFDLGMRVNIDGTRALLEACRAVRLQHPDRAPIRFLFTSSVAVFGGDISAGVTDTTTPTAQGSYGIQKYIGEQLVQDYTRKGFIDGRSVRVPTVVVRPGTPNGAASGFASGIIREPLAGLAAILPVELSTKMWMASPAAVINMLSHAIDLSADRWGWNRSLNLPGITVSMNEAVAALTDVAGTGVAQLIVQKVDPKITALVNSWPNQFSTSRANAMGFVADPNFHSIVKNYIQDNPAAIQSK
jgi:D-erythronate 2-dehydrogenase